MGWPPSGDAGQYWDSPGYAYQDSSGDIWFARSASNTVGLNSIGSSGAAVGPDTSAVWQNQGLFSFAMLFGDTSTVNVTTEYGDPAAQAPGLAGPIPLQPVVHAVFGQPADTAQGTLFVVLADATLNVLAKNLVAGWSLVPVQQDTASVQELDAWRVQLSVTDANGVPVADAQLGVTADRPTGTWQAGSNALMGPGNPVTFTTDASGWVTFATPAVELDAPQLAVQVVSTSDDGPLQDTAPVPVSPDAGVHGFLAGGAPLNDMAALTPEALLTATKADGTRLCPVLASITDPGQQAQAASGVISAISQAVQAGQGATPGPNDIKSWTLDLTTGKVPTYTSSTQPPSLTAVGSLSDWWDNVENDAESFFHGLRHDAAQIATCTANWVKDEAGDAWHWVVSLAVTIADAAVGTATYLITDMKSAIHAVTAFFNKLGADIAGVITWLRQNISELLKEAGQNAAVVEGWLSPVKAPATVNGFLDYYKNLASGFFANLTIEVNQALDDLAERPDVTSMTFGNPLQSAGAPGPRALQDAAFDVEEFVADVRSGWFLDKITSFFSSDPPVAPNTPLQDAMDELAVAVQAGLQAAEDIGQALWEALKDLFASRDSYNEATFASLFGALKGAVDNLLAFADAIVQALLDLAEAVMNQLATLLSHEFDEIPLIGGLLRDLGVDDTMSVGHMVAMVLMYPATLANRIKNGSTASLFPGTSTSAAPQLAATHPLVGDDQDWGPGLKISASVAQGIWGLINAVADVCSLKKTSPPPVIGWVNIVAPCILNILQWPGAPNDDGTVAEPFVNAIAGSGQDGDLIEPTWLLGWVPPVVGLCGKGADYKPASGPDDPPPSGDQPSFPDIGTYFTAASAIAATITGSIYNFQTGQSKGAQAAGILANVSNIIAPFMTDSIGESTEGVSWGVKLVVDAAGNLGAAAPSAPADRPGRPVRWWSRSAAS